MVPVSPSTRPRPSVPNGRPPERRDRGPEFTVGLEPSSVLGCELVPFPRVQIDHDQPEVPGPGVPIPTKASPSSARGSGVVLDRGEAPEEPRPQARRGEASSVCGHLNGHRALARNAPSVLVRAGGVAAVLRQDAVAEVRNISV